MIPEMQGSGWAPWPLVRGGGVLRVSVSQGPRSGQAACPREGKRSRRRGRAPLGRPFARLACGGPASRGPGGEARAPRPWRALRVCQFLETSRPGAESDAGTAREPLLAPGPGSPRFSEVGGFPARRTHRRFLFLLFLRPEARLSLGSGFSGWADPMSGRAP